MKTRIKARYIVGYDCVACDHVIYKNAELVFENDSVVFVGYGYPGAVDRELDFGGSLVSPGFIDLNAAADLEDSDLFLDAGGDASRVLGRMWSQHYYDSGPRDLSDAGEEQAKYRYMLCRIVSSGTTTALPVTSLLHRGWAEGRAEFEAVAATAAEIGLRTYLGPSFRDGVNVVASSQTRETRWNRSKGCSCLAEAVAFIRNLGNSGLVRGALIPSTVETCSRELLRRTAEYADKLAVPVRLHATQSQWEFETIRERYGKTPVEHIAAVGLLSERFLLPHALYLGQGKDGAADVDRLAESRCTVLHCPDVIARGGIALRSFSRFARCGVRVAVATDCCPPDMIRAMRIGLLTGRIADGPGSQLTSADLFRAATLAGAEALGRPDLGRLCAGAKADITVIDLGNFHINAVDDPIRALALSADGSKVSDVFVNGRDVVRGGRIPGADYDAMRKWADSYFGKLKQSYSERDYLRRQPDALFPPAFPTIQQT